MSKRKLKLIGHMGVDAGMCWIGDPCYVLPDDARNNPGANWDEFCSAMRRTSHKEFPEGVCVTTGYGDGNYPVYADIDKDGLIHSVMVEFVNHENETGRLYRN
tara:strand:- start:47 stop:355 length:309 start_codon:yes stop_codon:yes gene_type:complete